MLAACSPQENTAPKQAALDTELSKVSYAIGLDVANSLLKGFGSDIDRTAFVEAFNAQMDGAEARLTAEEAGKAKQDFFQKRAEKQAEERKAASAGNKVKGEKFLAENAKKDGVTTTASGLQYEVLKMGDGAKPKATDKVKVHYRGTTLDGKEFDSSYKRGQPISFPLNGVIKGWTEGVQLMPVGSKFKFYIPAGLAYGERGAGAAIAPNSTLIFEVELLGIEAEKPVESPAK
jgi:FKBP-type peptidyl-prolyl cis-trans isomerase